MPLPDYLIIGETKCGTTSLYNYLIQHPNILDTFGNGDAVDESYATKEIRFFDRYFNRGIEWYKGCFPETSDNCITGEATPMYMYRTLCLQRIHQYLPKTKFIIILRNPVDRLYSHFSHMVKWNPAWQNKYKDFSDFINSTREEDYYMIDKGLYAYTIERWYELFKRDRFCIIITEELQKYPQNTYNTVLNFLGMENYTLSEFKTFRENKYNTMDNSLRDYLVQFYRPYNERLSRLLNRDLNWDI